MKTILGRRPWPKARVPQPDKTGTALASARAPAPRSNWRRSVLKLMIPLRVWKRLFDKSLVDNQPRRLDFNRAIDRNHEARAVVALDLDDIAGSEILDED